MEFINVLNKSIALELEKKGFKFWVQELNDRLVYSFIRTPQLINALTSKYSAEDFFISKTMNF